MVIASSEKSYDVVSNRKVTFTLNRKSYHVVFNRPAKDWTENVQIMASVCLFSKHEKLTGWFILQCRKGASTLRVGSKRDKPPPRTVFRYGKQDKEIDIFERKVRQIKRIMRKMNARAKGKHPSYVG